MYISIRFHEFTPNNAEHILQYKKCVRISFFFFFNSIISSLANLILA